MKKTYNWFNRFAFAAFMLLSWSVPSWATGWSIGGTGSHNLSYLSNGQYYATGYIALDGEKEYMVSRVDKNGDETFMISGVNLSAGGNAAWTAFSSLSAHKFTVTAVNRGDAAGKDYYKFYNETSGLYVQNNNRTDGQTQLIFIASDAVGATNGSNSYGSYTEVYLMVTPWNANDFYVAYNNNGTTYAEAWQEIKWETTEPSSRPWINRANGYFRLYEVDATPAVTYTLTYDENCTLTSGATPAAVTEIISGTEITVAGAGTMVNGDLTLFGWNTQADGEGTDYAIGSTIEVTDDVTLYAVWGEGVTLTFDRNYGTGDVPSPIVVTAGTTVQLPAAPLNLVRDGWLFGGWRTEPNGGSSYAVGANYTVNADVILYARWNWNQAALTYNANGADGGTAPSNVNIVMNTPYTLPGNPGGLYRDGYSFNGWNTAANGSGTHYDPTGSISINAATTLYAEWVSAVMYTLTYDANGATGSAPAPESVMEGLEHPVLGNTTGMTNGDLVFRGWTTNSDGTGSFYAAGDDIILHSNITIYAKWTVATVRLTYDGNNFDQGGTAPAPVDVAPGTQVVVAGNTGKLIRNTASFTFGGWNGASRNWQPGEVITVNEDVTLKAIWTWITSQLQFDKNGGTGANLTNVDVKINTNYTLPTPDWTKDGKVMTGWNTAANGSGTHYDLGYVYRFNSAAATVKLYAEWADATYYNLSYDANGATSGTAPATETGVLAAGHPVAANTGNLAKTDWTFVGWNTQADGSGTYYPVGEKIVLTGNTTVYAMWSQNAVTLTYSGQWSSDTGTPPAPVTVVAGTTITVAANTGNLDRGDIPEWYEFINWNDPGNTKHNPGTTYTVNADVTFKANYDWLAATITYNVNGATTGYNSQERNPKYSLATVKSDEGITKTGYLFDNWNSKQDGTGAKYHPGEGVSLLTSDITLYAQWRSAVTYTVTFDANGGTGSAPAAIAGIETAEEITIPGSNGLTKSGYRFGGWNTAADGSGTNYAAGSNYIVNDNVTLYAKWIEQGTVTYDANCTLTSGAVPEAVTVDKGSQTTLAGQGTMVLAGYRFVGWDTNAAATTATYEAGANYTVDANVTLYAIWKEAATLYYNANGATGEVPAAQSVDKGENTTVAGQGALLMPDYVFTGWNTAADGSGTVYTVGASVQMNNDVTVYAQWTKVNAVITYNANGGTGSIAADHLSMSEQHTLSNGSGFTRENYRFVSWNTQADGSGVTYLTATAYSLTGDLTLYAQWVRQYTVTYYANGANEGTAPAAYTGDINTIYNIAGTGTLARTDLEFLGWNTAADGSGTDYTVAQEIQMTADLDLYAQWSQAENKKVAIFVNGTTLAVNNTATLGLSSGKNPTETAINFELPNTANTIVIDGVIYTKENLTTKTQWNGKLVEEVCYLKDSEGHYIYRYGSEYSLRTNGTGDGEKTLISLSYPVEFYWLGKDGGYYYVSTWHNEPARFDEPGTVAHYSQWSSTYDPVDNRQTFVAYHQTWALVNDAIQKNSWTSTNNTTTMAEAPYLVTKSYTWLRDHRAPNGESGLYIEMHHDTAWVVAGADPVGEYKDALGNYDNLQDTLLIRIDLDANSPVDSITTDLANVVRSEYQYRVYDNDGFPWEMRLMTRKTFHEDTIAAYMEYHANEDVVTVEGGAGQTGSFTFTCIYHPANIKRYDKDGTFVSETALAIPLTLGTDFTVSGTSYPVYHKGGVDASADYSSVTYDGGTLTLTGSDRKMMEGSHADSIHLTGTLHYDEQEFPIDLVLDVMHISEMEFAVSFDGGGTKPTFLAAGRNGYNCVNDSILRYKEPTMDWKWMNVGEDNKQNDNVNRLSKWGMIAVNTGVGAGTFYMRQNSTIDVCLNMYLYYDETQSKFVASLTKKSLLAYDPSTITWTYAEDNRLAEIKALLKCNDQYLTFDGTDLKLTANKAEGTEFTMSMIDYYRTLTNYSGSEYPSNIEMVHGYMPKARFDTMAVKASETSSVKYSVNEQPRILLGGEVLTLKAVEQKCDGTGVDKYLLSQTMERLPQQGLILKGSGADAEIGLDIDFDDETWRITSTETAESPFGVIDSKGEYANIVDTLIIRFEQGVGGLAIDSIGLAGLYMGLNTGENLSKATAKIYVVRSTYHTQAVDEIIFEVEDGDTRVFSQTAFTDKDTAVFVMKAYNYVGSKTLTVGKYEVDRAVDTTDITGMGGHDTHIMLLDSKGVESSEFRIPAGGTENHTIKVVVNQDGHTNFRYGFVKIYSEMTLHDKRHSTNKTLYVIQRSQFSDPETQVLLHQTGFYDDYNEVGEQLVHEADKTFFARQGDVVELRLQEQNFFGWLRWYDYDTKQMCPQEWTVRAVENNGGTHGDKYHTVPYHLLGTRECNQGAYTNFRDNLNSGQYQDHPVQMTMPLLRMPDENTHRAACDVSNYIDFSPKMSGVDGQARTAIDSTAEVITEPTLSYRQIWTIRPAKEMADSLAKCMAADQNLYDVDSIYYEDHTVTIGRPTDYSLKQFLLRSEYRYKNFRDTCELCYFYYDGSGRMKRVGNQEGALVAASASLAEVPVGWSPAVTANWYLVNRADNTLTAIDDIATNKPTINTNTDFMVGYLDRNSPDTLIYILRTSNGINLCRYILHVETDDRVGPYKETAGQAIITDQMIAEKYVVMAKQDFNFNTPKNSLPDAWTDYANPLEWDESSLGFCHDIVGERSDNRLTKFHFTQKGYPDYTFPFYGEYGFYNKLERTSGGVEWFWWNIANLEQRGGAKNGYMLYCDGTQEPGQVCALHINRKLCPGQKMYVSMWIANASDKSSSVETAPSFSIQVQGSGRNGVKTDWYTVSEYMTGAIKTNGVWYQVQFEIDLRTFYDQYRLYIYNFACSTQGNDFVIDDVQVFATPNPVTAFQTTSECSELAEAEGQMRLKKHFVMRVDYNSINDKYRTSRDLYYRIAQYSPDSVKADSIVMPLEYYYGSPEGTKYGHVVIPQNSQHLIGEESIASDSIYPSLDSLLTANREHNINAGYVYEVADKDGNERYVLYVVHTALMAQEKNYSVQMANTYESLDENQCHLEADFNVSELNRLTVDGKVQEDEKEDVCGNTSHELGVRSYEISTTQVDNEGSCSSDWLVYTTDEDRKGRWNAEKGKYDPDTLGYNTLCGATWLEIKHILKTLRSEQVGNKKNLEAKDIHEVDSAKLITNSGNPRAYQILLSLVSQQLLTLHQSTIDVYIPNGKEAEFWVIPIAGTGVLLHNPTQAMGICTEPFKAHVGSLYLMDGELYVGNTPYDELPASLQLRTTHMRALAVDANTKLALPLTAIKNVAIGDSIRMIETNDPDFYTVYKDYKFYYVPDRKYNFEDYDNIGYYEVGDTIFMTPASSNNFLLHEGFEYTFEVNLMSRMGAALGAGCDMGKTLFVLCVVPEYLQWSPKTSDTHNWNSDDNWMAIDSKGDTLKVTGYVPLEGSNVVLPGRDSAEYPYPSVDYVAYDGLLKYDVNYIDRACDTIRFKAGAMLHAQHKLQYNTAAVDMALENNVWNLVSTPIKGLYSGDIYMESSDSALFLPKSVSQPRSWMPTYIYQSFYNQTVNRIVNENIEKDSAAHADDTGWSESNSLSIPMPVGSASAIYPFPNPGDSPVIRLPKPDTRYYYYYKNTGRQSDRYEDLERPAGYGGLAIDKTDMPGSSMNITLTSENPTNTFTFGNPAMAYMDMYEFIADNSSQLEASFQYFSTDGSSFVSSSDLLASIYGEPTDLSQAKDLYLAPMRGVILTTQGDPTTSVTLTLNEDVFLVARPSENMLYPNYAPGRNGRKQPHSAILTITAENSGVTSSMRLVETEWASNEVLKGEDVDLMTSNLNAYNGNAFSSALNIYMLEGNHALSLNMRETVEREIIPVGFALADVIRDVKTTKVSFAGSENFTEDLYFLDAVENTITPIKEGLTLEVRTPRAGEQRYYIYASEARRVPTSIEEIMKDKNEQQHATAQGVKVYDMLGRELYSSPVNDMDLVEKNLPSGVYVLVNAQGAERRVVK